MQFFRANDITSTATLVGSRRTRILQYNPGNFRFVTPTLTVQYLLFISGFWQDAAGDCAIFSEECRIDSNPSSFESNQTPVVRSVSTDKVEITPTVDLNWLKIKRFSMVKVFSVPYNRDRQKMLTDAWLDSNCMSGSGNHLASGSHIQGGTTSTVNKAIAIREQFSDGRWRNFFRQ